MAEKTHSFRAGWAQPEADRPARRTIIHAISCDAAWHNKMGEDAGMLARPGVEADTRTAAKLLDPGVLAQRAS